MFFNALPVRRLYQNSSNETSFFNGAVSIEMSHTDFLGDPVLAAPEKEEAGMIIVFMSRRLTCDSWLGSQ